MGGGVGGNGSGNSLMEPTLFFVFTAHSPWHSPTPLVAAEVISHMHYSKTDAGLHCTRNTFSTFASLNRRDRRKRTPEGTRLYQEKSISEIGFFLKRGRLKH